MYYKINTQYLGNAFRRAKEAVAIWEALENRLAALDPFQNSDVIHESKEYLERRRAEVLKEAELTLNGLRNRFSEAMRLFKADIVAQTMPDGENLHVKARNDLELLDRDLIASPDELERIRKKYSNILNPAMLRAIEKYAARYEWPGFEFTFDAELYRRAAAALEELAEDVFTSAASPAHKRIAAFRDVSEFIDSAVKEGAHRDS